MGRNQIGIVVKHSVPEAKKIAGIVKRYLKQKHKLNCINLDTGSEVESPVKLRSKLVGSLKFIIVLGGDGTFLAAARMLAAYNDSCKQPSKTIVPILGVNMGQLGFLTEVKKTEILSVLDDVVSGSRKITTSKRTVMRCRVYRGDQVHLEAIVLNDIVVSRGAIARIFDLRVELDRVLISEFKADGVLVSTPTGSTAYGLAVGGPIVHPDVPAFEIAPICPHSLTLRPLIVSDRATIDIYPRFRAGTVILTLDGQSSFVLENDDRVEVTRCQKQKLHILGTSSRNYFSILREKLKFGSRE